jgi:twitching motility protein PilT
MQTFENILRRASESGASDIHLKVNSPVMFRIQRELYSMEDAAPSEAWITEILGQIVPPHLQEALGRDREVDFAIALPGAGRFRVNVYQQRGSYVLALRLVRMKVRSFEDLRLPTVVRHLAEAQRGILLVCGAPGAGKSTTLAAIIDHLNSTVRKHIITLEDPIEYYFEDKLSVIEQREIGLDTATFSSGLRNILRQDPDVLVIGEMRDADSVGAAVSAANVGALAIATLHTADAARSIRRILEFFPGNEREQARRQLATTLHAVICQKLVRPRSGEVLPAVEILINNSSVAKLIETDRLEKLNGAIELGTGEGMQTFDQALQRLASSGVITTAEALAHSPNPDTFRMKLQGVSLSESNRILNSRG